MPYSKTLESEWKEMGRLLNLNRQQICGQEICTLSLYIAVFPLGFASKQARGREGIDTVMPLLLMFTQFGGFERQK